jgi:hypothetical protein
LTPILIALLLWLLATSPAASAPKVALFQDLVVIEVNWLYSLGKRYSTLVAGQSTGSFSTEVGAV